MRTIATAAALAVAAFLPTVASADDIGSVNTSFHVTGSDYISVEAIDDPDVKGVTCDLSRARKGGIVAAAGFATDVSEFSIACRQYGPIDADIGKLADPHGVDVFKASANPFFKAIHVRRFVDAKRNMLVYLAYSDKLFDGSPKNSISSVPVQPWR